MNIQFPNETAVRAQTRAELAQEFDYARRLLGYWLFAEKDRGLERCELSPIIQRVVVGMNAKVTRQFRTVYELCDRAEAVNASAVARSMFESALAIHFVLTPRFAPRTFDNEGKVKKRVSVPGKPLSRQFRATLFVSHYILHLQQTATRLKKRPSMKRGKTP